LGFRQLEGVMILEVVERHQKELETPQNLELETAILELETAISISGLMLKS
jgi:hypothetical protein